MLEYEIKDDDYYLFSAGELSSREIYFIDGPKLKRMVNARNREELLKLLKETFYSKYLDELESGKSFEEILCREFADIATYLTKRLKKEHIQTINILFLAENIHNLKLILKSLSYEDSLDNLFIPLQYTHSFLVNTVESRRFVDTDPVTARALEKIATLSKQEASHREMDMELEKAYLDSLCRQVFNIKSNMIKAFLKHSVDIYNIKNIYRYKLSGDSYGFDRFLSPNGFLEMKFLKKYQKKQLSEFLEAIEKTRYSPLVKYGGRSLAEERDFSIFEKNEDIFYRLFFEPVRYTTSNLEKVFDYFLKKKIEIKNLNIIYTGVNYGVDKDKIRHEVLILDEDKNRSNW
ncbi:MAG: V-type ATPase subunit [Actinomycetota bacterium]